MFSFVVVFYVCLPGLHVMFVVVVVFQMFFYPVECFLDVVLPGWMLVAQVPNPHPLLLAVSEWHQVFSKFRYRSRFGLHGSILFALQIFYLETVLDTRNILSNWAAPRYGRTSLWFDKATLRLRFFEQRHQARTSCPAMCTILLHWSEYVLWRLVISYFPLKLILAGRIQDTA